MKRGLVLALALTLYSVGTALAENVVQVKNLKVLAVIYRGEVDAKDRMDDHAVTMAKKGLELGRLFYYRNSRAQLNVELDWLVVDRTAPENAGPTMDHIVADLHERGIQDGEYDGLIATGVGFKGNWGGFNVLGGAGGCFGIGSRRGTGYPEYDPDTGYGWAWIFAHEFQHALDLVIVENSDLDMLHSHPYVDRTEEFFRGYYQGGEHWDWIAITLREFDDYLLIKGMRNEILDCIDADGDGLADDDPRLPMDEKRFGSDSTRKDTDGDGLDDLHEFCAERHAGSDPREADTDGDGLRDSEDPHPVVALRPTVAYATTVRDDTLPVLLDSVFARSDAGGPCAVHAAWTEKGLRFQFRAPRDFHVIMKIDGSAANGFWEGGDSYVIRVDGAVAKLAGLGLRGDVSTDVSVRDVPGGKLMEVVIPAQLGQGVSKEINYGGTREPQDVCDGLTLVNGRSIGVNFIFKFDDGTEAALTPHHTMYSTRLVKPAGLPDHPILRGPASTNAAVPEVEVLGVSPTTRVHVVTRSGNAVGARVGPGVVRLVGLDQDGTHRLVARTPDGTSDEIKLLVDREALPPELRLELQPERQSADDVGTFGTVVGVCEPAAQLELWWGIDGTPAARLAGVTADESGTARIPATDALRAGWVVTAFHSAKFTDRAYVEGWPKIDRHFKGGAPDKRLGVDDFAYRFQGYLDVPNDGRFMFELNTDDGSRLFIDEELVLDHWGHHGMMPKTATTWLTAGLHPIRIDYYEEAGWAGVKFRGGAAGDELTYDLPVVRTPLPLGELDLFGVQIDVYGNRSGFSDLIRLGD